MSWHYGNRYGFPPYVPVARRRAQAAVQAAKIAKKEKRTLAPIEIDGRAIACSFWGKAWCENLESYSDFANRLPRGRTYVRNGSVVDLQIEHGKVKALVSGSSLYRVEITIKTVPEAEWSRIKKDCTNSIASLLDLLQGRFDKGVMERLSRREGGLFPQPKHISMSCSCPDWAVMCKHVAAVLYGVGARLDSQPKLLFTLRHVDHLELISQAVDADSLDQSLLANSGAGLADADLGAMFGIELDSAKAAPPRPLKHARKVTEPSTPAATPAVAVKPRASKKPAAEWPSARKQSRKKKNKRPATSGAASR